MAKKVKTPKSKKHDPVVVEKPKTFLYLNNVHWTFLSPAHDLYEQVGKHKWFIPTSGGVWTIDELGGKSWLNNLHNKIHHFYKQHFDTYGSFNNPYTGNSNLHVDAEWQLWKQMSNPNGLEIIRDYVDTLLEYHASIIKLHIFNYHFLLENFTLIDAFTIIHNHTGKKRDEKDAHSIAEIEVTNFNKLFL